MGRKYSDHVGYFEKNLNFTPHLNDWYWFGSDVFFQIVTKPWLPDILSNVVSLKWLFLLLQAAGGEWLLSSGIVGGDGGVSGAQPHTARGKHPRRRKLVLHTGKQLLRALSVWVLHLEPELSLSLSFLFTSPDLVFDSGTSPCPKGDLFF